MTMTNDDRDEMIRQIFADVQELKNLLHRHDKTLYGNGRPGIAQAIESVAQAQRDCPARMAAVEGRTLHARQSWLQIVLAALMAALAAYAVSRA